MTGPHDPSAAIVRGGEVVALADEERFVRFKHAYGIYPRKAIRYCLDEAGIELFHVDAIGVNWDIHAHTNGSIARHYAEMGQRWNVDPSTASWQADQIRKFSRPSLEATHKFELRRAFGAGRIPPIVGTGHHYTHAFQAAFESPFDEGIVLVLDGSGDLHCTTVWAYRQDSIKLLHEVKMPHSLGWFYAAITEYLGFDSSDGEYKVMGMAAIGKVVPEIRRKLSQVVFASPDGIGYELDPAYIHYGDHSWSGRFTDALCELLEFPPRSPTDPITERHFGLAACAQSLLEESARRLVSWAIRQTGIRNVCLGGGVAMNVKMNTAIGALANVDGVFAHPACADNGAAAGSALALAFKRDGLKPAPVKTMALGPEYGDEEIRSILVSVGVASTEPSDLELEVAQRLASGQIVGWFTGRMEAGSRALGRRSILADPRSTSSRHRVNAAVKFRESWRPFGPSILSESLLDYVEGLGDSRFMMMGFSANDKMRAVAPAVVHVDGSTRPHSVHKEENPRYHRLISRFEELTGVPMVLNTSFNLAGEPVVCTPLDALRTFFSSGLDCLAIGNRLIEKSHQNHMSDAEF